MSEAGEFCLMNLDYPKSGSFQQALLGDVDRDACSPSCKSEYLSGVALWSQLCHFS